MALPTAADMYALNFTEPELQQLGFYNMNLGGSAPIGGQGFLNPSVQSAVGNVANNITKAASGLNNSGWSKWFGNSGIINTGLNGLATLGQIGAGIFSGIMADKNYALAKDMFDYQRNLGNRNLANQAKILNNTYDTAGVVGAGLAGYRDANGNYGGTDPKVLAAQQAQAKKQHVDGSAI